MFSSMGMIFKFRQLFFGNKCISKDLFFISRIPALHYSIQKRKLLFEEWEEEPVNLVRLFIYLSIYLSIFPYPIFFPWQSNVFSIQLSIALPKGKLVTLWLQITYMLFLEGESSGFSLNCDNKKY